MNIPKAIIIENSSITLLARVRANRGDYIQQADIASLTVKVFNADTKTLITSPAAPTLVIADCVYDTLQTEDARWDVDAKGFNLEVGLDGDNFGEGNTEYRVEIHITPIEGKAFYIAFDLEALELYSE